MTTALFPCPDCGKVHDPEANCCDLFAGMLIVFVVVLGALLILGCILGYCASRGGA